MAENNSSQGSMEIVIAERHLFIVIVTLLVVGVATVLPTAFIRWQRNRLKEPEYALLLIGVIFYIAYEVVLIKVMPVIYKLHYFMKGQVDIWGFEVEPMQEDISLFVTLMFVSSLMSWSLLWSVKLSLLVFYRRLMMGLPRQLVWWNVVFGYTILTYIYSMVTTFTSCGGPINFNRNPLYFCARPGDNLTRNLSFYGAFASDITSDLFIMLLPMKLIWNLQMSVQRKFAVGAMFSIGLLVIATAVVRLVQIDSKTGSLNPNSQWLSLWGTVEATTAIIVGCLPTFRFFRKTSKPTYAVGYPYSTSNSAWEGSRKSTQPIPLQLYSSEYGRHGHGHVTTVYGGYGGDRVTSSREGLTPGYDGAAVTTRHKIESHNGF